MRQVIDLRVDWDLVVSSSRRVTTCGRKAAIDMCNQAEQYTANVMKNKREGEVEQGLGCGFGYSVSVHVRTLKQLSIRILLQSTDQSEVFHPA